MYLVQYPVALVIRQTYTVEGGLYLFLVIVFTDIYEYRHSCGQMCYIRHAVVFVSVIFGCTRSAELPYMNRTCSWCCRCGSADAN